MTAQLAAALLAHADGDLCAEAAARLLIAGRWPDRGDFASRFITMAASPGSGIQMAVVDWPAAAAAPGNSLPCSGGERRLLQVTASLAAGIPVDLRDAAAGLDHRNLTLVTAAIRHAAGHQH